MDDHNTGKLGDEVIKIAQAMLLCSLPYSATTENHITRTARLGDNSTLTVTFSRGIPDVPLPFGSDRKLLAWVFDRAINSESPMIAWESAWEYQKEMGLKWSEKNNKDLRERFHRISGLNINIERKDAAGITGKNFSIIDTYNLPLSITGTKFNPDQQRLGYSPEAELPPAPLWHRHQPDALPRHKEAPRRRAALAFAAIERELAGPGHGALAVLPLLRGQKRIGDPMVRSCRTVSPGQEPQASRQHAWEATIQLRLLRPGIRVEETETGSGWIARHSPCSWTIHRRAVCAASARRIYPYRRTKLHGELPVHFLLRVEVNFPVQQINDAVNFPVRFSAGGC